MKESNQELVLTMRGNLDLLLGLEEEFILMRAVAIDGFMLSSCGYSFGAVVDGFIENLLLVIA